MPVTPVAHFDERELAAFKHRLRAIGRAVPGPLARTLNRGLTSARAEGASAAAAALGIQVGRVKRRIWQRKATKNKLHASLTASTRRIPVRGRATKRGVTAGRGASRTGFVRAWKHGNVWLQRLAGDAPQDPSRQWVTETGRRTGRTAGYGIQVLTTPSVASAWTPKMASIEARAITTMRKTFDHELTRLGR